MNVAIILFQISIIIGIFYTYLSILTDNYVSNCEELEIIANSNIDWKMNFRLGFEIMNLWINNDNNTLFFEIKNVKNEIYSTLKGIK